MANYWQPIMCGAKTNWRFLQIVCLYPIFKSNINSYGSWTMVEQLQRTYARYTNILTIRPLCGIASDSLNDGTHKGGILTSMNGGLTWQRQMQFPKNQREESFSWNNIRSVHGKLFVETSGSTSLGGYYNYEYHSYIGLMNDSASDYQPSFIQYSLM